MINPYLKSAEHQNKPIKIKALRKLDLSDEVINQTRKMLHRRFGEDLFQNFKFYIPVKDWPAEREKIIPTIRGGYALCQLYALENMWEELFKTVKKYHYNFNLVENYFEVLMKYNKEEMIALYC